MYTKDYNAVCRRILIRSAFHRGWIEGRKEMEGAPPVEVDKVLADMLFPETTEAPASPEGEKQEPLLCV